MTRLETALQRSESRSLMEMQSRRGSTSTSRRGSVSQQTENRRETEQNGVPAIFKRASRFLSQEREDGGAPVRHYERGRPLPANCSPERKAIIPFRNPDLGLPSYRRRCKNLSNEAISGLSPQRHLNYSNFRRGDSQSRASPRSGSPRSTNVSPQRPAESRSSSHRRSSTTHGHRASHTSSRQASGRCSPSRRRGSKVSHVASPSRSSGSNKYVDSFSPAHRRSPSQSSYGHSLDSEKLYKNLKSIASSAESDASEYKNGWSKGFNSNVDGDFNERNHSRRHSGRNSRKSGHRTRDFSPPGGYDEYNISHKSSGRNSRNSRSNTGYNSHGSSTPQRDYNTGHSTPKNKSRSNHNTDGNGAYSDISDKQSRSESCHSQNSNHSPISATSPASTPNISQSRRGQYQVDPNDSPKSQASNAEANKPLTDRSRSNIRRGLEAIILSENTRSSSQPAVPEMTIEDYVIIADIPRCKLYPEEEETVIIRRRPQSRSPRRDNQNSCVDGRYEHEVSEERGRGRERGRDRREKERRGLEKEMEGASNTSSTASGHSKRSSNIYEDSTRALNSAHGGHSHMQLDSLHCEKGWMCMLDEDEEWRKYWFVITDSELRYYRDAEALKRDDADGEIYLHHCLSVEEFDADKDYGLQLHMRDGLVTLSTTTSRIRRNWINILRSRISFRDSAESIHDNSDISENSGSLNAPRRTPPAPRHQHDLAGGPDMTSSPLTNRREAGEGRDKEHERRLEDRTKWFQKGVSDVDGDDPWEKVELKKGAGTPAVLIQPQVPDAQTGGDIERKWEDFEQLPYGELKTLSPSGSQSKEASNEDLQREVVSLRQHINALRQGRMVAVAAGACGPDAPCALKLEQVEREHKERLQEILKEHERERREMEREKQRLLQEEAHNTVQAMEALRKAHQDEIEKLKRHGGEEPTDPSIRKQLHESISLQREVSGLSERYSQQCVELKRGAEERDGEIRRKEREMEQLRKENQELQARLTEEISLMRSFITGQRSGVVPLGSYEKSTSELEMLLKVKESEVEYLHNEIGCLRKEVQVLIKENKALSERYKEVHLELSDLKGHSEREINALKEHLKLPSTAQDEGRLLGNSTNQ